MRTDPFLCTQRLAPGQTLQLPARVGDHLHVRAGRLDLDEAPCWLADTVCQAPHRLHAGQVHTLAASGWITLRSDTGAELALLPAGAPAMRGSWLRRLTDWCTAVSYARHPCDD